MDLVIRTYGEELPLLVVLLRSVELFAAVPEVGVVVVLDEDDRDLRRALPPWVDVFFEAPPPFFEEWPELGNGKGRSSRGYMLAQYSGFVSDEYSTASFLAFLDADAVLQTPASGALLFDGSPAELSAACAANVEGLKPRIFGAARAVFFPVIDVLEWPT